MTLKMNPGWIELPSSAHLERSYWVPDTLPKKVDPNEANEARTDGEDAVSPVVAANKGGGIGPIQWVNDLEGKAVILVATGGWREGGTFKVFISRCPGTLPVEITDRFYFDDSMRIEPGDNGGWGTPLQNAMEHVAVQLGIATVDS